MVPPYFKNKLWGLKCKCRPLSVMLVVYPFTTGCLTNKKGERPVQVRSHLHFKPQYQHECMYILLTVSLYFV